MAAARTDGEALAETLGCHASSSSDALACLRAVPAARLLAEGGASFGAAAYDTPVLPLEPAQALASGQFSAVPTMSGHTRDESRAFVAFDALYGIPQTYEYYEQRLETSFGARTAEVVARYPRSRYPSPTLLWAAVITDRMFAYNQIRDASLLAGQAPTYTYLFADPHGVGLVPFPPEFPSEASHTGELPLLFDLTNGAPFEFTADGDIIPISLSDQQKALGRTMIRYWTQFAHFADPNGKGLQRWPQAGPRAQQAQTLALAPGVDGVQPVNAYDIHQCAFWDSFLGR